MYSCMLLFQSNIQQFKEPLNNKKPMKIHINEMHYFKYNIKKIVIQLQHGLRGGILNYKQCFVTKPIVRFKVNI